ncbi:MAG: polyprenyl synthetase family protein [Bacteroidaceae bacterium]|nr:polyprenyl synthetase family protein [Bacteroidaceae bacterium]
MYTTTELIEQINTAVENIQYNTEPRTLYDPIRYILSIGGKRIRPLLMLMSYNLYKEDVDAIMNNALALETYHNFTLLHDDLMDKSDLRRGHPTVHKKWNENTAILSGDTMLIMAYQLFNKGMKNDEALTAFIDATLGVGEGQQYDIDFETRNDVTEAEYMEMIRMKTSLLLGYALKIGALLGGASQEDVNHLYTFGEKMGLAYQLQDDLLDVYGDPTKFQKKLGGDIVENKKTFMLINAYLRADNAQKKELDCWIQSKDFNAEEKIAAVTHIYNILGIDKLAQQKIEELFAESLKSLDQVNVPEEKKNGLRLFANKLMGRKY